jgi:thiol-disulfide isomerase/thioredoxin
MKKIKFIFNILFWVALIAVIFSTDLRAEVFGFIQRGVIEIGLVNPTIEENHKTLKKNEPYQLTLKNQREEMVQLSEFEDKIVFINFWATWCPPCIAEMPSINQLHEKFKNDKEIVFLMISQDKDFGKAKDFLEKKSFGFDIFQNQTSLPKDLRSNSIPATFVLDKSGNIVYEHMGMANYNSDKFISFLNELKKQ